MTLPNFVKTILFAWGFLLMLASLPAQGLDLLETYELGLSSDPRVLELEAKRNAVLKTKSIGLANLLPQIAVKGDFTGTHLLTGQSYIQLQANTTSTFWQGNFNLILTQPVFHYEDWVQYWQADHQIAQAQAELEAEYQNLAVRVARGYFEVLTAEETLEFTEIELKSLNLQLEQVKQKLAVGFATVVDQHEVQAQYDKVAADLILADQKLNDAREALREIIGQNEISLTPLPDELPLLEPEPADVEAWRSTAQQSNLGLIAAQSAAAFAKDNIDLNFSRHLPTVDLVGQKILSDNNRQPVSLYYDQSSIGVSVNLPIFSGGGTNARVEQARDSYEQALHAVDKQRRTTDRQVKDAFRGIRSAISRVGALRAALQSGQSAWDAAQMGYQVGDRTVVDVLIEQGKFFTIRRDYAKSRYDYLLNGLLLKQAAGTLIRADIGAVNALIHGAPGKRPAPNLKATVKPPATARTEGTQRATRLPRRRTP